jgi:hypothetical protein
MLGIILHVLCMVPILLLKQCSKESNINLFGWVKKLKHGDIKVTELINGRDQAWTPISFSLKPIFFSMQLSLSKTLTLWKLKPTTSSTHSSTPKPFALTYVESTAWFFQPTLIMLTFDFGWTVPTTYLFFERMYNWIFATILAVFHVWGYNSQD